MNSHSIADPAGKVILPPGFRKRDRRDRNVPSNALPIPPTHNAPLLNRNVVQERSRLLPSSQDDTATASAPAPEIPRTGDPSQHIESPARAVAPIHAVHPAPLPITPTVAPAPLPVVRHTDESGQIWTSPSRNTLWSQEVSDVPALDYATRAQFYDWYVRAAPMAQALLGLKKWREWK